MNKKYLMFGLPILMVGLVVALVTLSFTVDVHTSQMVFLNGVTAQTIDCVNETSCLGDELTITNNANVDAELKLINNEDCEDIEIGYTIMKLENFNVDSGLTGSQTEARWNNVHEMNVPGRNTIFIGLAASVAENMGIDEVWYGADYSDRVNLFPDCYQEYVFRMNEVFEIAGVKPIKLVAPLLGMPKELILEILKIQFDIQLVDLYSGYEEASKCCSCGPNDGCDFCSPGF